MRRHPRPSSWWPSPACSPRRRWSSTGSAPPRWCSSPAAALLLAARSYRHVLARSLLRIAGLYAWTALVVTRLLDAPERTQWYVVGAVLALAAAVLVAAVATGRGWRSVWWARRAEIGESLCGAFAVASLVVAAGLFRHLWELTSRIAP